MNNKFLLLAAAGTLAFASCQNETGGDAMTDEVMQAKIDSAVQSRMEEMQAQLAAQNDSLINAMAMMKADSILAARAAGGTANVGRSTNATTRPSTSKPSKPETVGNGKPMMGGDKDPNTVGNGKPMMGGDKNPNTVGNGKPKMGGDNK